MIGQIEYTSWLCVDVLFRFPWSLLRHLAFVIADEGKNGKILALTIKKRRGEKDTTAWWSGVLEGDDAW